MVLSEVTQRTVGHLSVLYQRPKMQIKAQYNDRRFRTEPTSLVCPTGVSQWRTVLARTRPVAVGKLGDW